MIEKYPSCYCIFKKKLYRNDSNKKNMLKRDEHKKKFTNERIKKISQTIRITKKKNITEIKTKSAMKQC